MKPKVRHALYGVIAVAGLGAPTGAALAQQSDASGGPVLEEVVITAQRREERIQDVPISVTALSQEQMDAQGVRNVDEVARLTPGVTFQRADARNGAMSTISIRGIASTGGASTTGVYIDDTPIQVRALGAGGAAFNAFPGVFDLDRVEVLRGPQGTLFGAGSEGGTVRFITPQPNLRKFGLYGRSEFATTQGGDASFELGAAFGAPLVEDKIAVRLSAWVRRDGGWVDRTDWSRASVTAYPAGTPYPPTAPTPASVTDTVDGNANWQNSSAFKAAVSFAPTENLTITPSIYYQRMFLHDTAAFWAALSDPGGNEFNNGNAINAESNDHFYLPALKVEWAFNGLRLVSNTSYFNRESEAINDYTSFETALWGQVFTTVGIPGSVPYLNGPYYPAGYTPPATSYQGNLQNNIAQELRLQSDDANARINWVVGLFYSHSRQTAIQIVSDPGLFGFIASTNAVGFGPPLEDGKYTFVQDPVIARDEQLALYAQADFKLTDWITATVGIRAADAKFSASASYHGFVVGPPVNDTGSQHEKPVTPKLGVSFKLDPDNMLYATASKGYRIGGYNPRVGAPCAGDANYGGYHTLFDSDSVWSYELGSKNDLLDHRVRINTSLYYIDWSNIQQVVGLSSCGFAYTSNLGKARSQGLDLQADLALTRNFVAGLAIGYNDARFTETVKSVPTAVSNLVTDGDHIVGWPWTAAVSAQYNFAAWNSHDAYVRADYQYQAKQSDTVPGSNPQNGGFQPWAVFRLPQTTQLSLRAGMKFNGWDVSVFGNNLTGDHPILASASSVNFGIPGGLVGYNQTTFRPRTFGITAAYRL